MSFRRPSGSLNLQLALDVLPSRDEGVSYATADQAINERRDNDINELYTYAQQQQQKQQDPAKPAVRHEDQQHAKGEYRERLASLIVRGPGPGQTFAERLALFAPILSP